MPLGVLDLAHRHLEALAGALGLADTPGARLLADLLHTLGTPPLADQPAAGPPRWSGLSDDATPFEFSVAFRPGGVDLRLLVEAQAEPASPERYWEAGRTLTAWLVAHAGADAGRAEMVADLFTPGGGAEPLFAAMHAVEVRADAGPRAKLYLNPAAHGVQAAPETIRAALDRLGLGRVGRALGPVLDRVPAELVALDLDGDPDGRVKLYLRPRAGVDAVVGLAGLAPGTDPDEVRRFVAGLIGGGELRRPAFVVLHLSAHADTPVRAVVDVPLLGHVPDDATAAARIEQVLRRGGLEVDAYRRCRAALTAGGPPPRPDPGLHSYVSFQQETGRPRVTTYFNSRAFAPRHGWSSIDPERTWPRSGGQVRTPGQSITRGT